MSLLDQSLYIVAEVANAAQGSVEATHRIIDAVSETGANAIKFQFYKYDELATPSYEKYENFRRTFYTEEERRTFVDHACEHGLEVLVDIFDRWGLQLAQKIINQIKAIKIPPAVIMDEDLVSMIVGLKKPILVGVGGYEDEDIDFVLKKLKGFANDIVLMHGFQGFPTNEEDSSLARIEYLKQRYNLSVGFADHIDADSDLALRLPEYAFYAGASIIEKHITLDRNSRGLDYYSSLLPHEFKILVQNLTRCVRIMGSKGISSMEKDYLKHSTRVTAVKDIERGDIVFKKHVKYRRTDNRDALFPNKWNEYDPAIAERDIKRDEGISASDVRPAIIGTVVGCRMHSTRLPKKALLEINGMPSIERCLMNSLASRRSSLTVLATSTHPDDAILKDYTLDGRAKFFRGAEEDLAQRILDAASEYHLDIVVRVTGDRPLISPQLIDCLIDSHLQVGADFSCFKNVPLGINPEVINVSALRRLKERVSTEKYSEYLTTFFKNNPECFKINEIEPPEEYRHPEYRMVLDYPEDLEFFRVIYKKLNIDDEPLYLQRVLTLLEEDEGIAKINSSIKPKYVDGEFARYLNRITTITK